MPAVAAYPVLRRGGPPFPYSGGIGSRSNASPSGVAAECPCRHLPRDGRIWIGEAAIAVEGQNGASSATAVLWTPFILFLRRALEATRAGDDTARRIWLEAAAELFTLDEGSFDAVGREMARLGRGAEALELAALVADLDADNARAHFRLAHALQSVGDHQRAIAPLERALALAPDLPLARNNLAAALIETGERGEEIIPLLEAAVAANPAEVEAWINLAAQECRALQLAAALEAGARAVTLAPENPLALVNFANALKEAGQWDEAEGLAERALALSGGDPARQLGLGLLQLLRGKYASGWEGYERRWDRTPATRASRPVLPGPPWRGEPLAGKTLLVWGEEGMGDVMQFCRFVPMLAEHVHAGGGRLVWNAFPQFGALLERNLGRHVDAYVTGGIPLLPPFDYEFPLLSTARLFGIRDETIPADIPYLVADPARAAKWRRRLTGERRLKVGLAWTGSPSQTRNPYRSIDPGLLARHFGGLKGVALHCLQVGGAAGVEAMRAAGLEIADQTQLLTTFDETAALIDTLDLVVTICTSVTHLAGAMGKPTWVLLDVNPHWVWGLERTDSLWYPTTTLYRQQRFAEWDAVLDAVARDLKVLADTHAAASHPRRAPRRRATTLRGAGARSNVQNHFSPDE